MTCILASEQEEASKEGAKSEKVCLRPEYAKGPTKNRGEHTAAHPSQVLIQSIGTNWVNVYLAFFLIGISACLSLLVHLNSSGGGEGNLAKL